jgi:hypothetical protein
VSLAVYKSFNPLWLRVRHMFSAVSSLMAKKVMPEINRNAYNEEFFSSYYNPKFFKVETFQIPAFVPQN